MNLSFYVIHSVIHGRFKVYESTLHKSTSYPGRSTKQPPRWTRNYRVHFRAPKIRRRFLWVPLGRMNLHMKNEVIVGQQLHI